MKNKILQTVVLVACCMFAFGTISVWADSYDDYSTGIFDDFEYSVYKGRVCILNCTSTEAVVQIPQTINGYPVTSIYHSAFSDCKSLTSILFPNTIEEIGSYAFNGCTSLEDVILPNGIDRIDDGVFKDCSGLKTITIPESVTSIGAVSFSGCTALTEITIPDGVTGIGEGAFGTCSGLIEITIPESVISIGSASFGGCSGLTEITIPDSVTGIGDRAFQGCTALTDITIGNGVKSIGHSAFYGCKKLTNVYIKDIKAWCEINCDSFFYSSPLEYAQNLYLNNELITNLIIPHGVKSIGDKAFYNCKSLTSVTIPDSVTYIGDAFRGCTQLANVHITDLESWCNIDFDETPMQYAENLYLNNELVTDITIPSSITSLGDKVFYNCKSLSGVIIPDSVTSVGDCCFYECDGIIEITMGNGLTTIGQSAFFGCTQLTDVYYKGTESQWEKIAIGGHNEPLTNATFHFYKDGLEYIQYVIIDSEVYITSCDWDVRGGIVIPSTIEDYPVTVIGEKAFYSCNCTGIVIPDSVKTIGNSAFEDCYWLTDVTMGNSVINIGEKAFYNGGVCSISIPDSVTSIGDYCFCECDELTEITIGNGITSFGDYLFYNCGSLTSIKLPDGITSIGDYSFHGCRSLTGITIPNGVTHIGESAFWNCYELTEINIPSSVTEIEDYAFQECGGLTEIIIPDNVTSLGRGAFSCCDSLEEVTIGKGIARIEDRTFEYCEKIISVKLPESLSTIGDGAFVRCPRLIEVYYNGTREQWKNVSVGWDNQAIHDAFFFSRYENIPEHIWYSVEDGEISITGFDENIRGNVVIPSIIEEYPVTTIDSYAFYACNTITGITIPDSVISIGDHAFNNCTELKEVIIPDSVTSIGAYTFFGCINLAQITIPKSVTSVGMWAFCDCHALTDIYYNGLEEEWEKIFIDYMNDPLYNATIHYNGVEIKPGGTGNYGDAVGTLGNIFTNNMEYDGTSWSCDVALFLNGTISGKVYVAVCTGNQIENVTSHTATTHIPVIVECKEGQTIRILWWDANLIPMSMKAEIKVEK